LPSNAKTKTLKSADPGRQEERLHSNSNDNNNNNHNNNKKNNGAWCFPAVAAPPAVAAAFLCYHVLGTKLGGALLLRMCHKAMHFVILGGSSRRKK
jgi:hypothetical protein